MKNIYFQSIENLNGGQVLKLQDIIGELNFTDQGLIPVITQDATSKDVLMLAWMNKQSLESTLSTGRVTYWSRSRGQLWIKGETSGHLQSLVSMRVDCDGDAVLCLVNQVGAACHTGRDNCFYFEVDQLNMSVSVMSSAP
jgi:phosphoribosyl-AMP cyclohydrolase|tara:strand:- start:11663 stop:12082 length:420 start_codon:yes stop_codon:yes gene_type:complete